MTETAAGTAPAAKAGVTSPFRRHWSRRTELWVSLAGFLIALVVRLVYLTLRVRWVDPAGVMEGRRRGQRIIAAFWHDTIPLMPLMVTRLRWPGRVTVMLSWHRDAEIAARAVGHLGIRSVHGSSRRGWLGGLRGMLAAHAAGDDLGIAPDGPKGPRHEAKDGAVQLARVTGLPLVVFGVVAWPARRLGSWDRMQVPWPFARVAVVLSEPLVVARRGTDVEATRALLAAELERTTSAAAALVGAPAS